jgi:hypothetical protein
MVLPSGAPSITTNKLYSIGGSLFFNGVGLASGSAVNGTTGKISKFTSATSLSDSIMAEAGTTVTVSGGVNATLFTGSGASLTGVGLLASDNFWTGRQRMTVTTGSGVPPLDIVGTSDTVGAIGLRLLTATNQSTAIEFTDQLVYANAIGTDTTGSLHFWAGKGPVTAGSDVFSVTGGGNVSMAGTLNVPGQVMLGGASVTDKVGTPTIGAGFGAVPTIVGKDYGFIVTVGAGGAPEGTVSFSTSFGANNPACSVNTSGAPSAPNIVILTTPLSNRIISSPNFAAGMQIYVLCRGY